MSTFYVNVYNTGSDIILGNTIAYVSVLGNDQTAQVGNFTKPFRTIQAAVNSSQTVNTVRVFQGTYAENVLLPERNFTIFLEAGVKLSGYNSVSFSSVQNSTVAGIIYTITGEYAEIAAGFDFKCLNSGFVSKSVFLKNLNLSAPNFIQSVLDRHNLDIDSCTGGVLNAYNQLFGTISIRNSRFTSIATYLSIGTLENVTTTGNISGPVVLTGCTIGGNLLWPDASGTPNVTYNVKNTQVNYVLVTRAAAIDVRGVFYNTVFKSKNGGGYSLIVGPNELDTTYSLTYYNCLANGTLRGQSQNKYFTTENASFII